MRAEALERLYDAYRRYPGCWSAPMNTWGSDFAAGGELHARWEKLTPAWRRKVRQADLEWMRRREDVVAALESGGYVSVFTADAWAQDLLYRDHFVYRVVSGRVRLADYSDALADEVDAWHNAAGEEALHTHLGMTWEEYPLGFSGEPAEAVAYWRGDPPPKRRAALVMWVD